MRRSDSMLGHKARACRVALVLGIIAEACGDGTGTSVPPSRATQATITIEGGETITLSTFRATLFTNTNPSACERRPFSLLWMNERDPESFQSDDVLELMLPYAEDAYSWTGVSDAAFCVSCPAQEPAPIGVKLRLKDGTKFDDSAGNCGDLFHTSGKAQAQVGLSTGIFDADITILSSPALRTKSIQIRAYAEL